MSQKASATNGSQQSEVQTHQVGQDVFKPILPEDAIGSPSLRSHLPSGWQWSSVSLRSLVLTQLESKRLTAQS